MRNCISCFRVIFFLGAILPILGGCMGSEPARFYTLSTIGDEAASHQAATAVNGVSFGVAPVILPDYLDRPQIVTRIGLNELQVAEYDRWAGSLGENITMVVRENLSSLLGTDHVFSYPWNSPSGNDYKVAVRIIRLEGIPSGSVVLRAMWSVWRVRGNESIITREAEYKETMTAAGYDAMVAAMSRALANMSRDIAGELRVIISNSPTKE